MYDSNTAATNERKNSDSRSVVSSTAPSKRVILTMGGKGGVGKTSFMLVLAEWFQNHEVPVTLLDLDTENKSRGSLKHYFDGRVTKVNIHTAARASMLSSITWQRELPSCLQTWARVPGK
jgi:Mrp family chromosome partitioning ATPase